MRTLLLFLFASAVYVASAMPTDDIVLGNEERFVQIPDGNGGMRTIDLETDQPDLALLEDVARNPDNNRYFLWTRQSRRNSQQLVMGNANSVRNSHYNANRQTVVVVHGWLSNQNTDLNPVIRDAYLQKYDVNVIVMDWRRLALSDYYTAARGVPAAGRGLGQFVQWLINTAGGNLNNFHLVGFSLGAHLVGNAGRFLGGRVARVTGLDPAGPMWQTSSNRLNPNDGVYVEAIHTDGNTGFGLGIGTAVANADFFPNGGTNQPGCIYGLCDHNRAWELFAATVTHNHLVANQCSSSLQVSRDSCRGSRLHMGNADLRKTGNGLFRVNTRRRYPF